MPITDNTIDMETFAGEDILIEHGKAREVRSGSGGSHDSLPGNGSGSSLFGGSSFGSATFGSPPTNNAFAASQTNFRRQLPHPETDFPENTLQSHYQDQMTKLRSSTNQATPIPEHITQVVPPEHHPHQTQAGPGGGSSGNQTENHSSSYEHSSDDCSLGGGRTRSPSLINNLCQEFASAATISPGGYGGGGGVLATEGARLLELTNRTGYPIIQRNGQRIYGPPPGWGQREFPSKGTEVFVGRVPRDIFEPDLVPVFERVGQIYELRLMMDFSGSNRGFFFVRYTCREAAKRACKELDNHEIRPHKRLGVLMSLDNNKLWLSGIPEKATSEDIKAEIDALTEGVCRVILYPSPSDRSRPRKYAFVEYKNHRAAALARRRLVPTKIVIKGHEIEKVDWAEPQNEVDEEVMSKVKVLFVRNLSDRTSEEELIALFNQWSGHRGQVERVKKNKDYAFVHFYNRASAEMAKTYSDKQMIDGETIEVEWGKPVDKTIYNTRKALTKLLSQPAPPPAPAYRMCGGGGMGGGGGPGPFGVGGLFPQSAGGPAYFNSHDIGQSMRGAPGTLPPRNLIKKLTGGVSPGVNGGVSGLPPHHFDGCRMSTHAGNGCGGYGDYHSVYRDSGDNFEPAVISKALNELKHSMPLHHHSTPTNGILGSFPGLTHHSHQHGPPQGSPPIQADHLPIYSHHPFQGWNLPTPHQLPGGYPAAAAGLNGQTLALNHWQAAWMALNGGNEAFFHQMNPSMQMNPPTVAVQDAAQSPPGGRLPTNSSFIFPTEEGVVAAAD